MTKIIQLNAENVKVLKAIEIHPTGNVVELSGKNGQGKSSVLDSIIYALSGKKSIPSEAVRNGEDSANIKIELENITITRIIKSDGSSTVKVESKDGAVFKSPQSMLDELTSSIGFDPLAFAGMDAKKQFETLRDVVQCDFDFETNESKYREIYDQRTIIGRNVSRLQTEFTAIEVPESTPTEEINIANLINEFSEIQEKNAESRRLSEEKQRLQERITSLSNDLAAYKQKMESIVIEEIIDTKEIQEKINNAESINANVRKANKKYEIQKDYIEAKKQQDTRTDQLNNLIEEKKNAIKAIKMPVDGLAFGDSCITFNDLPLDQCSQGEKIRISTAIAMGMAKDKQLRVVLIKDGSLLDEDNMKVITDMATDNDFQVWIEKVDSTGKIGIVIEDGTIKTIN